MIEKRKIAIASRKKDLNDKYLECDPLPDPSNEKDLTTFITLWREGKDKTLKEAVENCQVAENVVQAINLLLSEAMSQYDYQKIKWCEDYIDTIREIMLQKYDDICQYMFTYIEKYTVYSDEEWAEIERKNKHNQNKRGDSRTKPEFLLNDKTEDMSFGMWANVIGK
jgi:hypothetical protein